VSIGQYLTPAITFGAFLIVARKNGEPLSIANAFTSLSLISLLSDPLSNMFQAMPQLSMTLACFGRINKFLLEEDRTNMRIISQLEDTRPKSSQVLIETDASTTLELNSGLSGTAVMKLENATFGTKEGGLPIIRSLDLNVNRSSLTMIVGKVGSGKSTLLKGLISEIPLTSGSMQRCFAEAGFCEQQAWLVNDTIQNNILGQSNLEARWYDTVVKSCALYKDFALLQLGDLSVIGSKGISLSGGQKQRLVSLNLNAKIIY
jgi:ATP-binding cassette subfamily C (CFTR/MRP) protein 1